MNQDQRTPNDADAAVEGDGAENEDRGAETPRADDGHSEAATESDAESAAGENENSDSAKADEEHQFLLDQLQRARAELDNFRRRTAEERLRLRQKAIADVFRDVSSCLDDLEMAVKSGGEDDPVAQGVQLTLSKFERVMSDFDVVAFGESGDEFDPQLHEAMLQIPSDEVEAGRIIDVFHRGYRVGELLVRAARVTVAKPTGE